MHRAETGRQRRSGVATGFTIVELLVVMLIILLIIVIVLPALGGARTVARVTATRALINDFLTASDQFKQDHAGRSPGYFAPRDMGSDQNLLMGFTSMQNAMLDLAGGITDEPRDGVNVLTVGCKKGAGQVRVDIRLIGSATGGKSYFTPLARNFVVQDGVEGGEKTGSGDNRRLPEVVDSFGQPLLLWSEDDGAIAQIDELEDFAVVDSSGNKVARFYWNANSGVLQSKRLGRMGKDQTFTAGAAAYSLIGGGLSPTVRVESLAGLLGNPSFPINTPEKDVPLASRGRMVVMSAGPDGYYVGSKDKGAKNLDSDRVLRYQWNHFVPGTTNPYLDDNGNPTTVDIVSAFDDVLLTGGN